MTQNIALGVGIILPLSSCTCAKAAATADQLSNGRLLLGVASGDRQIISAMGIAYANRSEHFQDSMHYIRAMAENTPLRGCRGIYGFYRYVAQTKDG